MLMHEIKARNVLSFGPDGIDLKLRPLNVLIGPNGSGKSNLIDLIDLLRAAPTDLAAPVRESGGITEWIWKGQPGSTAAVEAVVEIPYREEQLRHRLEFTESSQRFELLRERIDAAGEDSSDNPLWSVISSDQPSLLGGHPRSLFAFEHGRSEARAKDGSVQDLSLAFRLFQGPAGPDGSVLGRLRDPDQYPELTYLGHVYSEIQLYRDWWFGRRTGNRARGVAEALRHPQRTDLPSDRLEEDFSNLALILSRIERYPTARASLLENLRDLYEGLTDFRLPVDGGTIQVSFYEGNFPIPATRLSDGSLRYLCLLAILCDPKPPPLVGIEEPELGLHPDLMPTLARLLKAASERTQVVITTHSDILVDAFTDQPESVIVCEKPHGQTTMKRLESDRLNEWLKRYRLGELWTKGEIGGVRW